MEASSNKSIEKLRVALQDIKKLRASLSDIGENKEIGKSNQSGPFDHTIIISGPASDYGATKEVSSVDI
jgi:hypothetical protein